MVNSLESLCVQSVAENLGKGYWPQSFLEDENGLRYWMSPFALLSPSTLISLFKALKNTEGTTRQEDHLGLLITKKLEELDLKSFSRLSEGAAFHLLSTAALRHSSLRILTFSFAHIPYHKLQDILPAFPNLQVLDVSRTRSINEHFLALVASSCPRLKSLHLENCAGVNDVGMERLCSSSSFGKGGGLSNSLVKLEIQRTHVTERGARLALKHFVKLKELEYDFTVQVIGEMFRSGERQRLALRTLEFKWQSLWLDHRYSMDFQANSLATAVNLCPFLLHVEIDHDYEPSSLDLRALLELKNLQSLTLRGNSLLSFEDDFVPILKKFGHKSLHYLHISEMDLVNLGAFVEHCSNLRTLILHEVRRFVVQSRFRSSKPSKTHLPCLDYLVIRASADGLQRVPYSGQPSASDLALLLNSAPALMELKLEELDNLSDRVFQEIVAHHGFSNLEEMDITSCPNVTGDTVSLFLDLGNPALKDITIERYKHWDNSHEGEPEDYEDPLWKEKIARNHLKIKVYYCECSAW